MTETVHSSDKTEESVPAIKCDVCGCRWCYTGDGIDLSDDDGWEKGYDRIVEEAEMSIIESTDEDDLHACGECREMGKEITNGNHFLKVIMSVRGLSVYNEMEVDDG